MKEISIPDLTIPVEYDKNYRIKYHPELHQKHGVLFSEEELEYACKYYEIDGPEQIGLTLGRTTGSIMDKVSRLRKNGKFEYYKNLNKHW